MRWVYVVVLAVGVVMATPLDWPAYRKLGVYLVISGALGLLVQSLKESEAV